MKTAIDVIDEAGTVLVVGLGRSGRAVARLLADRGVPFVLSDSGRLSEQQEEFRAFAVEHALGIEEGGHSVDFFLQAGCIIVSPGVPLQSAPLQAAREKNIPIIGELGLAAAFVTAPMVAITGSNGKSTVTTLVGDMLQAAGKKVFVGGNLGTPLTEYVLAGQGADIVVLEVSSFQLDTVHHFAPEVAVLLNVSPDHLDRYANYEEYAASKFRIFRDQIRGQKAVVNADDPDTMCRLSVFAADQYQFGISPDCQATFEPQKISIRTGIRGPGSCLHIQIPPPLRIGPGPQNAASAALAASLMGCPAAALEKALHGFVPLAHRMTLVRELDGVRYVDDSKATNIGALKAALEALHEPVVVIAGGRDKEGDYRLLLDAVQKRVKAMVLIGEARFRMAEVFGAVTQIVMAPDMPGAVARAREVSCPGDVVLLSPACASFDMFQGYAHRGRVFAQSVAELLPVNLATGESGLEEGIGEGKGGAGCRLLGEINQ